MGISWQKADLAGCQSTGRPALPTAPPLTTNGFPTDTIQRPCSLAQEGEAVAGHGHLGEGPRHSHHRQAAVLDLRELVLLRLFGGLQQTKEISRQNERKRWDITLVFSSGVFTIGFLWWRQYYGDYRDHSRARAKDRRRYTFFVTPWWLDSAERSCIASKSDKKKDT